MKTNLWGKNYTNDSKLYINKNPSLLNILVIDCGIKNSQLRSLLKNNVQLTLVNPHYYFLEEVLKNIVVYLLVMVLEIPKLQY